MRKGIGVRRWITLAWTVLLLGGCMTEDSGVRYLTEDVAETVFKPEREQKPVTGTEQTEILVYVCGAVNRPGVYWLKKDARLYQAVDAAGGFSDGARSSAVNLAGQVRDGQQIYIPSEGESAVLPGASGDGRVSINRASKAELMELPGIGEVRAEAIIAYRETNGAFLNPEDIMRVPGIKEAAYSKLKDRITVD